MKKKTPLASRTESFRKYNKSKQQVKRVIVLPDTQIPYHDKKTIKAVFSYIKDFKPDEVIQLGDFMDFDCISHWNAGNLRAIAGKTILDDYLVGNLLLDELQAVAPKAKITIISGNHDARVEKYIDANPQMEGMLEFEKALKFKERGINYVDFWGKGKIYKIGNASFIHGLYTGEHHAKKHVQQFGTNIFYGHLHDVQAHSLVHMGKDKSLVGQSLGCLCTYDQQYMKGKPSKWRQAFGIFYFLPNGNFTYYVVQIFNHSFVSPEGRLYTP